MITNAFHIARNVFGLDEAELDITPLFGGLVNISFKVRYGPDSFILQRLHPVFGNDGAAIENTAAVCESLSRAGLAAPRVLRARDGRLWAESDGKWRLMTWLPGACRDDRTRPVVTEAARMLGLFHRALAQHPPVLKALPPADYNREGAATLDDWDSLRRAYRDYPDYRQAGPMMDWGRRLAETLPPLYLEFRTYVHGDPKLDNFLFDDQCRAVGLIDLDTVRRGSLVWDIADGLRSWVGVRPSNGAMVLDKDVFLSAVDTYRRHGLDLPDPVWSSMPDTVKAIALNLVRRYLKDFFEGSYFVWDRMRYPSLAEQNLARAREMLLLAEQLSTVRL